MEVGLSLAFAAIIGFGHAFEADHLLAVSTLVAKSHSPKQVWKNGLIWGLGHTSTILLMGLVILVLQVATLKSYFGYFELFVGLMLIVLGILRLKVPPPQPGAGSSHDGEAYGIGLVHGLAGSGTLILLVLTDLDNTWDALGYLVLFGLGSSLGMSIAASMMRIPILQGAHLAKRKKWFAFLSSVLCIGYGLHLLWRFIP